jgi:excisionase family DNA binding protein
VTGGTGERGRRPLITTRDLARHLQVHPKTVQEWVRSGRITPTAVTPGGQFRFDLDDVLKQLGQPRKRPDAD